MIPGAVHAPRGMLEFWADPADPDHRPEFDAAPADRRVLRHRNTIGARRTAAPATRVRRRGPPRRRHRGVDSAPGTQSSAQPELDRPRTATLNHKTTRSDAMNLINPTISRRTRVGRCDRGARTAVACPAARAGGRRTVDHRASDPTDRGRGVHPHRRRHPGARQRHGRGHRHVTISREGMEDVVIDIADLSQRRRRPFHHPARRPVPLAHPSRPGAGDRHPGRTRLRHGRGLQRALYPAGTAFVDPGRGMVHTAYNPTDGRDGDRRHVHGDPSPTVR